MLGKAVMLAPGALHGVVGVPGDKSISHRALIAAASGPQPLRVGNLNPGRDVRATQAALQALGARITQTPDGDLAACGPLQSAAASGAPAIDCMNSGSTARMLLGVCAGANLTARFDGDASLRRRPMEPVAAQLRAFGARIETAQGCLPLTVAGASEIQTRDFILLSPSAQVKSALLFAGLFANVGITIHGDRGSRDHTERLLRYLGADVEWDGRVVTLRPSRLQPRGLRVPGGFSSAAFFLTAAAIAPGSSLLIRDAGVNPTRTGLLDILERMGARIECRNPREWCGEPVADLAVEYAPLRATDVSPDLALRAIDEIPLAAVAAAFATGRTVIAGVRDLRAKESDRIAAIEGLLRCVGIETRAGPNQLTIEGGSPRWNQTVIDTHDDHRIAMAAAVLACAAGPLAIDGTESIDVSFPSFLQELERAQA